MAKPNQNDKKEVTTPVKKVTTPIKKVVTPAKDNKKVESATPAKDNKKVESTTPAKDNKKAESATPAKDNKKVESTPTKANNNNKTNNKRKEPETKQVKEVKEVKESTNNNNKDNNKNVNKDNKKQQQKKQKTEQSKSIPTPKEESKQATTTTATTTTTTVTEQKQTPQQPTFSIFDSLKKLDTQPVLTSTTPTTPTSTSTTPNKNNKKESNKPNNNESLLKAFSTSNEYSEPNIKEINEKVETVLKEIKDNSPKEQERKLQKEKTKKLKESEKAREKQNPRTVFVSNIKLENANEKEIKSKFLEFGKIESVRFRSIPISSIDANRKETFIKKQFHEKRETCNAYIVYTTEESAKKAVDAMNGKELFGKHIRVDLASHKPTKESDAKCVFVGNVPYEFEEEELFLLFNTTFGNVLNVRIVRDQHTNIGKGFGYVNFNTEEAAKIAIEKKSVDIGKRTIRIFPTKANPKSGKTIKEKKKMEKRNPNKRVEKSSSKLNKE